MATNKYYADVFYSKEDKGYIANFPDLTYCSAFGDTPEEALREAQIALRAWLAAAKEHGNPIPEPRYRPKKKSSAAVRDAVNPHVVPQAGRWKIVVGKKAAGVYMTQREAIDAARKIEQSRNVIVHDAHGRIKEHLPVASTPVPPLPARARAKVTAS